MSIDVLRKACDTKETYTTVKAGVLKAVSEPLAVGLPVAASLLNIARTADPEKDVSFPVVWARAMLAEADKAGPVPAAKKS